VEYESAGKIEAGGCLICYRAAKIKRTKDWYGKQNIKHWQKTERGYYAEHNLIDLRKDNVVWQGDSRLYNA
jgi:hypothetical protein